MSSVEYSTECRELFVFYIISDVTELSRFISEHCFAKKKKRIKNFIFFSKISHEIFFHEIVMGYKVFFYFSITFSTQTSTS